MYPIILGIIPKDTNTGTMTNRCSHLADRVLWEGEGAISIRGMGMGHPQQLDYNHGTYNQRTLSIICNGSTRGDDDAWSVAYIRQESFRKLCSGKLKHRVRFLHRLRRRQIVEPRAKGNVKMDDQQLTAATNQSQPQQPVALRTTPAQGPTLQETLEERPILIPQYSARTTRDQLDGTSLLVKQGAKVFNRLSTAGDHLSIAESSHELVAQSVIEAFHNAKWVRRMSSMTVAGHSFRGSTADWGDPQMYMIQKTDDHEAILTMDSQGRCLDPCQDLISTQPSSSNSSGYHTCATTPSRRSKIMIMASPNEESVDEAALCTSLQPDVVLHPKVSISSGSTMSGFIDPLKSSLATADSVSMVSGIANSPCLSPAKPLQSDLIDQNTITDLGHLRLDLLSVREPAKLRPRRTCPSEDHLHPPPISRINVATSTIVSPHQYPALEEFVQSDSMVHSSNNDPISPANLAFPIVSKTIPTPHQEKNEPTIPLCAPSLMLWKGQQSTIVNDSAGDSEDGRSKTHVCEESLLDPSSRVPATEEATEKMGLMNQFRRPWMVEHTFRRITARMKRETSMNVWRSSHHNVASIGTHATGTGPTHNESFGDRIMFTAQHFSQTTRSQVNGGRILVKQKAKVFNRASVAKDDLSIAESSDESVISDGCSETQRVRPTSSLNGGSRTILDSEDSWEDPLASAEQTPKVIDDYSTLLVDSHRCCLDPCQDLISKLSLSSISSGYNTCATTPSRQSNVKIVALPDEESVAEAELRISLGSEVVLHPQVSISSGTVMSEFTDQLKSSLTPIPSGICSHYPPMTEPWTASIIAASQNSTEARPNPEVTFADGGRRSRSKLLPVKRSSRMWYYPPSRSISKLAPPILLAGSQPLSVRQEAL